MASGMLVAPQCGMDTTQHTTQRVSTLTSLLSRLLEEEGDSPHISIYQPAGRLPAEADQARIQLKVLLQTARERLAEAGVEDECAEALLKEITALTKTQGNDDFWNHQEGGLALFISGGGMEMISVKKAFTPLVVISSRYHLKPLMALAANVDAYHLLKLSQHEVQLLRGSALGIREVEVVGLPASYEEAMDRLGYPPDSFAASAAESHLKVDRPHLKTFFKEINQALCAALGNSDWPLLIAGDTRYESIYRDINEYAHLSEAYLEGNPEHTTLDTLHRKATDLLKSDFIESQKRTLLRLAKQEAPDTISTDLDEIITSASQGRIETLIVPTDSHRWGIHEADGSTVEETSPLAKADLYETAARLGLENGAEVFFLEANQIPKRADIMAKLRW